MQEKQKKKVSVEKYRCTRCDWEGVEDKLIYVPICPNCTTGHHPLYRLMRKRGGSVLECPNCSSLMTPDEAVMEPECPKCGNQYLKKL